MRKFEINQKKTTKFTKIKFNLNLISLLIDFLIKDFSKNKFAILGNAKFVSSRDFGAFIL